MMQRLLIVAALSVLGAALSPHTGECSILFYNGDPLPTGPAFLNQKDFNGDDFTRYTQFTVQASTEWHVSSLYANTVYNRNNNSPLNSPTNTQARYEIRSGVSVGNGGTLLYSGTASAVPVATGFSVGGYNGFKIEAQISGVDLSAGTYWFSLVPIDTNQNFAFVYNTGGTNGINVTPGQQTYSSREGGTQFGATSANHSMGITGTSESTVPEPASLTLWSLGILGCAVAGWRSRKRV